MKNYRLQSFKFLIVLILSGVMMSALPAWALDTPTLNDTVTKAHEVVSESEESSSWVKDVSVLTYIHEETQEAFVVASFQINLDGLKNYGLDLQLPTVSVPLYDTSKGDRVELGTIQVIGLTGAFNLRVNLTSLGFGRSDEAGYGLLPDGSPLPIAGLARIDTLEIPIPYTDENGDQRSHSLYLAVDARERVAMIGAALTFPGLDAAAKTISGTDIFLPFKFTRMDKDGVTKRTVRGSAGFFADKEEAGKSGFAVFIDIGGVISPQTVEAILEGETVEQSPLN